MTKRNDIELLFKEHFGEMHRLAFSLLHDGSLAADIVQDVFASMLERKVGIPVSGSYLMKAVRNRCLNHIRDCDIHQRIERGYFTDDAVYDPESQPDEGRIARIRKVISSELSPQARRIIELRFYRDLPFAEIASEMGISETAVFRHLRHALQKLNQYG